MHVSRIAAARCFFLSLLLGGLVGLPIWAQTTPKKDPTPPPAIRLPSGAIIIIAKDPDSVDKPDAIYLTPEKYKELTEQIEALRKKLALEKAVLPNECHLEGRLETRGTQTLVKLRAIFKFATNAPRTVVFLGCQKAQLIEAKMDDGKLPLLSAGEKGLSVLVESKGEHTISLDLECPLQPRGGEIGFELGLPGATITILKFEAPAKTKRLNLSRREMNFSAASTAEPPLETKRLDAERLKLDSMGEALGPITFLAVSWEDGNQPLTPQAARSADADIHVTIGETDVQTEARLRLRGTEKEWRFLAPFSADVVVGRAPPLGSPAKPLEFAQDQTPDVVRPEQGKLDWRVRFREPNSTEILVVIKTVTPRGRTADPKAKTAPLGPFAALATPRQEGTIHVRSLSHLRTNLRWGDALRMDPSDDPNAEAIYRYRALPTAGKDQTIAPMELEISPLKGVVQTRVHHFLKLAESGWRLRSEITVTPIRSDVETLDIEVPVPGTFEDSTPKLVETILPPRDISPSRRVLPLKLAAPQRNEFSLTLEGFYPLALGAQEATLILPRLLNTVDRSGQVTVTVPDGFDLRGGVYQLENDKSGSRVEPIEPVLGTSTMSTSVSRSVSQVELSWHPVRADIRVDAVADIVLADRQAQVSQHLHFVFADRPQRRLKLRGPTTVTGVSVSPGAIENNGPGEWTVVLPAETTKEVNFTLTWSFPLAGNAEDGARTVVPLIWPEGVTSCESRVRFLRDHESASRLLPVLEAGAWQELPVEVLPTEVTLLVVRGRGLNLPLTIVLRDGESASSSMPQIWIDRTLIQAQAVDTVQKYRARFHLVKWQTRAIDLELPANLSELDVRINGVRADSRDVFAEAELGRVVRIQLPAWRERQRLLIDLKYNLLGNQSQGLGGWLTRWHPPIPRGRVSIASVRWQVAIPQSLVPLSIGDADAEERWTVRSGYLQSTPAYGTSDLDLWITSGIEPDGSAAPAAWEMNSANVTARQPVLSSLRIVQAPRMAWLIAVSLSVLLAGLLLSRLPRRSVGVLLILIVAGLIVAGFLWPLPAGQAVVAAQPGLAILVLVLGLQHVMQWRYRRRLARMPGFSRIHPHSAASRSNGKHSVRGTSTVDSPAVG